jgi:multicomponent Na+:H+ antiporter subunit E
MSSNGLGPVAARVGALLAVWLLLTQKTEVFYLVLGLATAIAVVLLSPPSPGGRPAPRWARVALYMPWLFWQVLLSGRHVAYLILHPAMPIDPKLVRYKTDLNGAGAVTVFGNSITLTPGTITADVTPGELVVHAMDDTSASGLADMEQRVADLFGDGRARS